MNGPQMQSEWLVTPIKFVPLLALACLTGRSLLNITAFVAGLMVTFSHLVAYKVPSSYHEN